MKSLLFFALVLVLAPCLVAQTPTPTPPVKAPVVFTEKDRDFALKYLGETKDEYVKQLTGLSDAQLNFRSAEGRWTIAEIAEHITVVENALFGLITGQIMKSAPPNAKTFSAWETRRSSLRSQTVQKNFKRPSRSAQMDAGKLVKTYC